MRGRHEDSGWTYQRADSVAPAQPSFGTEGWATGADGALVIPVRPPVPPTLRSTARRTAHRHRYQLAPWAVLLTLPPLAYGAHKSAAALGVIIVSAVIAAAVTRMTWPQVYPAACAAAGAGWVTWASLDGLRGDYALPVLIAAWTVMSMPWWNSRRIRHHHPRPEGEPAPLPPITPDQLLTRLRERICGAGGRLAGAIVNEDGEMKGGRTFLFSLIPGHQNFSHVQSAAHDIASAAEVPRVRVVAEPAPGDVPGEDGPANLARVTILDANNAHREIQEFDGMTLARETGLFTVGPYPDLAPAPARLYKVDENGTPMRAASGLTSGVTGAGKSRYVDHKIIEHLMSGLFQVFFLDGQGGASSTMIDHVDWPALRPSEWSITLRAAVRLMIARTRIVASRRAGCWLATPEDPFVQVVIEEAHKPLRVAENMRMVKAILQEGEKAGVGIDLVTQFPSQIELGGNSGAAGANVIRSMASGGNVVIFRAGDDSSKSMAVGAVEVQPRLLPQRPGMCYALGASMRTVPVRAIRIKDPGRWTAAAPRTTFSDHDKAALGGDYATRWERFAEHDAEPEAATIDMRSIEHELALITGEAVPSLAPASAAARSETQTAISEVWKIISDRKSVKRAELISALKCSPSSVDQALKALEGTGKVRKGSGHGVWQLALHAVSTEAAGG